MKTDTLKFKAVLAAIVLASLSNRLVAMTAPGYPAPQAIANGQSMQGLSPQENEFFESMVLKIRDDAIKAIIDLIKKFIDPHTKDNFARYIEQCKARELIILRTILTPFKETLETVRKTQPGSQFHKMLESMHTLVYEMAYTEIQKLVTLLENHKKSPEAKKATALAGKLKPQLTALTSIATLNKLENKLDEIFKLMPQGSSPRVVQELNILKVLIQDIKKESAIIASTVNVELLPIISAMLKRA